MRSAYQDVTRTYAFRCFSLVKKKKRNSRCQLLVFVCINTSSDLHPLIFLKKERSYANSLLKGEDTDTKGRNNWLPFRPRAISLPLTYLYFLIRENLSILYLLSVVLAHPLAPIFRLVPKMNMR